MTSRFLDEHNVIGLRAAAAVGADAAAFWEDMAARFPSADDRYAGFAKMWRRYECAQLAAVTSLERRADMLDASAEGACPSCGCGGVSLAGAGKSAVLDCQRCGATWATAEALRAARTAAGAAAGAGR